MLSPHPFPTSPLLHFPLPPLPPLPPPSRPPPPPPPTHTHTLLSGVLWTTFPVRTQWRPHQFAIFPSPRTGGCTVGNSLVLACHDQGLPCFTTCVILFHSISAHLGAPFQPVCDLRWPLTYNWLKRSCQKAEALGNSAIRVMRHGPHLGPTGGWGWRREMGGGGGVRGGHRASERERDGGGGGGQKHDRAEERLIDLAECCFTSTETVGLFGTEAQDVHLDIHTAPELWLTDWLRFTL